MSDPVELLRRILEASPLREGAWGDDYGGSVCVHCKTPESGEVWGDPKTYESFHVVHIHAPDCPWMAACLFLDVDRVRPGEDHRPTD